MTELSQELNAYMLDIFHRLHMYPEIGFDLPMTVALVKKESLQAAINSLADVHLVKYQNQKKKYLAYPFCRYADEVSMAELTKRNIPVIVHVILGLPGETADMQYETISYLNRLQPFGIKLQLLHILKGTDLADYYDNSANDFKALDKQEYLNLLIGCIERLSPDIIIHRVTGDGPKNLLIVPTWSLNKRDVLNSFHRQMREQNAFQGRLYQPN